MRSGSLNAQWVWHIRQFQHFGKRYQLFQVEPNKIECYGVETIVKFCLQKVPILSLLYWYTLKEGLGTAKWFVGVVGNDVKSKHKGGAAHNNSKQLLQASLVIKLIQNLLKYSLQKPWTQSLMALSRILKNSDYRSKNIMLDLNTQPQMWLLTIAIASYIRYTGTMLKW